MGHKCFFIWGDWLSCDPLRGSHDSQSPHMVSPPQMPVPLKRMYNANIPRAEITIFVPSCPPMLHTIIKPKLSFFKNCFEKKYANFMCFELRTHVGKKVRFAQISRNILAPIPRKDTNSSHRMCPSENLT